ncbi:outer membrane beta-barrel protein [Pseudoduganella chitinolytica]|uniref:Outer membrane beta-barrel protein n=1 Tax=Pseudoduganella chitinolytica TaxID=34070 RepID=A0ABY8BED0_9BURK|nr:outer membrane beta-barrel protein [Pseudoduganella chitinolytica]WEF32719.1 outer membrane beta-barrel protein [Pseudoduganella chitinolytica]
MKKFAFAFASLLAVTAAQAQQSAASPVRFMVGAGLSVGGDNLATVEFTDGHSEDLKAGGLLYLTAGADYRISEAFSLQGTINYHVNNSTGDNGDVRFQRFPVELIGYYHINPQWRVGAGVRYTNKPKISSSGVLDGMDFEFDNTTSGLVEAEYFYSANFGVKVRYVHETYKKSGYRGDVSGKHVGVSAAYYF